MKIIYGYIYTAIFGMFLILAVVPGLIDEAAIMLRTPEPMWLKVLVPIIILAMFGFWFLMLADFFSHKDTKHPVLVGFALIFMSWFAILVYFWWVVRPRETLNK